MIRETACCECPFRRESAPGYLGEASYDPEGFIAPHWYGGLPLPCHLEIDWEASDNPKMLAIVAGAPTCHGYARMMRNCAKLPHDRKSADELRQISANSVRFFANLREFCEHHKGRK